MKNKSIIITAALKNKNPKAKPI